ncbi:MAG: radical SAM/SPASM domain-containing protein [Aciduliprofundum sp.]|nr:MAG: radical SAM/SPASM domain-containing protein [Aciduliprofundum sp.]
MKNLQGTMYLSECPATPTVHASILEGRELKRSVTIYVTRGCNLRCKTCYISAGKPLRDELSVNDYRNIFLELKELDFQMVYILGGEPMLRGDIFHIIWDAKYKGLYASMSSNGYFIDHEKALRLKESGLDQIQISIDSADEKMNDYIRGRNSFSRAVAAVKNLKDVGMKVSIAFTITSFYYDIMKMIELAESLNVEVINLSVAQPFGRAAGTGAVPTNEQVRNVLKDLEKTETDLRITFNGFRFFLDRDAYYEAKKIAEKDYHTCPAGRERFVIDSNGDVYGCELLISSEFREGNVKENDLREIWRNGFHIFRDRRLPNECISCPFKDLCQGGCPARSYLAGGLDKKDLFCKSPENF